MGRVVNRPSTNLNLRYWLRYACEKARAERAFVILTCDTAEQAAHAAKLAAKWLPRHQRAAPERMLNPADRERSKLS